MKVDNSGQMFVKGRKVRASCEEPPQMMIVVVVVVVEKIRNETLR